MRWIPGLFFATLVLVAPAITSAAPAADRAPLLAVLDFETADKRLDPEELLVLTDVARSVIVTEVGRHHTVLTRETMLELLPPDRARCATESCAAEIGRLLQADRVISGMVRRLGTRLVLMVDLYQSRTGRLLGSAPFRAPSIEALVDEISARLGHHLRPWFAEPARPPRETDLWLAPMPELLDEDAGPRTN